MRDHDENTKSIKRPRFRRLLGLPLSPLLRLYPLSNDAWPVNRILSANRGF